MGMIHLSLDWAWATHLQDFLMSMDLPERKDDDDWTAQDESLFQILEQLVGELEDSNRLDWAIRCILQGKTQNELIKIDEKIDKKWKKKKGKKKQKRKFISKTHYVKREKVR